MKTPILGFLVAASFAGQVFAQLAQTLTTDPQVPGKLIYVASSGSTSSVAAPIAIPTLVYNCYNMPLICENIASWAKIVHPSGNGDLGQAQTLYFDPDETHKDKRRAVACGCFHHDGCSNAVSNGKQAGVSVQTIARSGGNANALSGISSSNIKIILAGTNPPRNPTTGQLRTPRLSLNSVPGRFFAEGVAFSCDEFPAATFINGGTNAKTSCALQSWQIFSGADVESVSKPGTWPNTGKWPLPPGSGIRMEQDWQAQSHVYLRSAFGVGGKAQRQGWGTVYPFSFTTTTLQQVATKAYVVNSVLVTQIVNKRDQSPTVTTYYARTTNIVSGDLGRRGSSEAEGQSDATTESKFAKLRVKRGDQTMQSTTTCSSSGTASQCSMVASNATTYSGSLLSTLPPTLSKVLSNTAGSSSNISSGTSPLNMTQSTASSHVIVPGLLSVTSNVKSTTLPFSSSFAIHKSFLALSNFSQNNAPHFTSYTRSLRSATLGVSSTTGSVLSTILNFASSPASVIVPQSGSISASRANGSSATPTTSSLGASEQTLLGSNSRPPANSSLLSMNDSLFPATSLPSSSSSKPLSQRISTGYSSSFLTSTRISSQPTSVISPATTISSGSQEIITSLVLIDSSPFMTSQASTSTLGNAEAGYSATAISSNVAAASGYAILLKADPSNKSKARAAQKSTHDSLNLALDLFHRSRGGSPFGRALSALISALTKASSVADAAVDASTPDNEEQDAEELVSDLEEAAQDAEKVKEEKDNDDDDETTTTSTTSTTLTTSTTSTTSTSKDFQTRTKTSSRSPTSAPFTSSSLSSSVTSSAPTAGPSVCTLSFDISGDEDIEVGDDGYDPSTGDNVGCVPVIGAGGVASGCGIGKTATEGPSTWLKTSSNGLKVIDTTSTLPTSSAVSPVVIPSGQPKPSSQVPANNTSSTQIPTTCIPDGTPWMSPTSWCDCGTAKYSTTPNCAFTALPSKPLTPTTTTSPPTNTASLNGLPTCALYDATEHGYGLGTENYCVCNGTLAPLLTHSVSSNSAVSATTDCSYTLQPTNTLWTPSPTINANSTPSRPLNVTTVIATTTPDYPVTTILVLITTLLPPPGRPTVYSTVYVDPPSPTTTTTTSTSAFRDPLSPIVCTNDFSNVDESLCWANCVGGTCSSWTNPFLNSEPWYVCSGCS